MTEEQIKQNAEAYAGNSAKHLQHPYEEYKLRYDAYTAGAHSRDEEIGRMNITIRLYANHIEQLRKEIEQLRNPWINVLDNLPEEDHDNKGYSVNVIGLFPDGRVSHCFCSIDEDIWFIEGLICDKPTNWMPMPKLPNNN